MRKLGKEANRGWVTAEWGGWECYMAPHNEEDDPAIYRSSTHKGHKGEGTPRTAPSDPRLIATTTSTSASTSSKRIEHDPSSFRSPSPSHSSNSTRSLENGYSILDDSSDGHEEEEEEDSTLLTVQPGYNRLLLVLRDERVMRFVKYVSAAAEGSRWDVCGEYEVGMLEEQDD